MLFLKVWFLPHDLDEGQFRQVHLSLVEAVSKVPELHVLNESDMLVVFPADLMAYGLGEHILIEFSGLEMKGHVKIRLRRELMSAIGMNFPKARINCEG